MEINEINIFSQTTEQINVYIESISFSKLNIGLGKEDEVILYNVHCNKEMIVKAGVVDIFDFSYSPTALSLLLDSSSYSSLSFLVSSFSCL